VKHQLMKQGQATTPETTFPTVFNKRVGSLTSPANNLTLKMHETWQTGALPTELTRRYVRKGTMSVHDLRQDTFVSQPCSTQMYPQTDCSVNLNSCREISSISVRLCALVLDASRIPFTCVTQSFLFASLPSFLFPFSRTLRFAFPLFPFLSLGSLA